MEKNVLPENFSIQQFVGLCRLFNVDKRDIATVITGFGKFHPIKVVNMYDLGEVYFNDRNDTIAIGCDMELNHTPITVLEITDSQFYRDLINHTRVPVSCPIREFHNVINTLAFYMLSVLHCNIEAATW